MPNSDGLSSFLSSDPSVVAADSSTPATTIEVTSHRLLRNLLRHQPEIADWHHYLTMTRLVARGLRLSKSALIQTGVATHRRVGKYRLSYLIPALLWDDAVTIAIPTACQSELLTTELPRLQQWLGTTKQVYANSFPTAAVGFKGLWLIDPQSWLQLHLDRPELVGNQPTIIDRADDLENWAQALLTVTLNPQDWASLRLSQTADVWAKIVDVQIQLLEILWQRPIDPYNCYALDPIERSLIESLPNIFSIKSHPNWQRFYEQLADPIDRLVWATIDRDRGTFTLAISPIDLGTELAPIWKRQSTVFVTSAVDISADAIGYRQELGLDEITSVKFSLLGAASGQDRRHTDLFQLYIPRWMPMPNTPNFQPLLVAEVQKLLHLLDRSPKFTVILIHDTPLKSQLAAILAAEWGTRVRVEQTELNDTNILISGWEFWQSHQDDLPTPQLMLIATLPIPSLEDPLVAAKVSFYKQQKQDWFRLYLLPTGLRILHRAIDPIRCSQGMLAIFDNRINHRSYGKQVLAALSPAARINYPDLSWLDR